jgi:hypothetical protein
MKPLKSILVMMALGSVFVSYALSQEPSVKSFEYGTTVGVFGRYCSSCHEWASSYESLTGSGYVIPGDPEGSRSWNAISAGFMPPSGPAPTADEKQALLDWIQAGAPKPEGSSADALSGATSAGSPLPEPKFFGFQNKVAFHRAAGWTSTGLLLAAGAVGLYRALDMQSSAHEYRDSLGIDEESMGGQCVAEIQSVWNADQALRWTHVGLLVAGESVYLMDAVTGIGFIGSPRPGIDRSDLHRWAFFTHGSLMAAEIILGLVTSDALKNGDHELVSSLGVAHAAIGLTIPTVMLAAGLVMTF